MHDCMQSIALHTPHMHSTQWHSFVIHQILCKLFVAKPIRVAIAMIFARHPPVPLIATMMASLAPEKIDFWMKKIGAWAHFDEFLLTKVTAVRQTIGKTAQMNATWRHESIAPKAIAIKMPTDDEIAPIVMTVPRIDGWLQKKRERFFEVRIFYKGWQCLRQTRLNSTKFLKKVWIDLNWLIFMN